MESYLKDIEHIMKTVEDNGIFIYPTDTVYGLGTGINYSKGIERINSLKQRDDSKSFILLVNSREMLENYVAEVPIVYEALLVNHPKPISLIYQANQNIPLNLRAKDSSIAIRLVKDNFLVDLIAALKEPLISTSANFKGEAPSSSLADLNPKLIEEVDYVVEYKMGKSKENSSSALARINKAGELVFLRE